MAGLRCAPRAVSAVWAAAAGAVAARLAGLARLARPTRAAARAPIRRARRAVDTADMLLSFPSMRACGVITRASRPMRRGQWTPQRSRRPARGRRALGDDDRGGVSCPLARRRVSEEERDRGVR